MKFLLKNLSVITSIRRRLQASRWEGKWCNEDGEFVWELNAHAPSVETSVRSGWLVPGSHVLDIGCGLGFSAAWLAEERFKVLGVDISETAIAKARQLHANPENLDFQALDVTANVKLERQFDAVIDRGCLHGISPKLQPHYVTNLISWLKPGGGALLLMASFNRSTDDLTEHVKSLFGRQMAIEHVAEISMFEREDGETCSGLDFRLRKPG